MPRTTTAHYTERDGLALALTRDGADALGADADLLLAELQTVLAGFAAARQTGTGRPSFDLLATLESLSARLAGLRTATIRAHIAAGVSHGELAGMLGHVRTGGAQYARRKLADPDGAELWATGRYAPVDHPGIPVPKGLRSWSHGWPGYLPVNITPPELRADALARPARWVRDTVTDPGELGPAVWVERSRAALVPFDNDDRWYPLNPTGRTGRTGRNLASWGENAAADPIIVTGTGAERRILLIKRDDRHVWAFPGGHIDPGESGEDAAVREAREETGVDLSGVAPKTLTRTVVDDWRNTDHAWMATVAVLFEVPAELPARAADDAEDARWWPFPDLDTLAAAIEAAGGELYDAHRPLLATALDCLGRDQASEG